MGSVYRARRVLLRDEVAIKVIRADDATPTVRDRFVRESRAAASLHHPNIVGILDFHVDASRTPFLVMELLNGPSVKDEIAQRGRLEVDDVRRILPPLCNALELAHRGGIVHRDLKPANIVRHDFAGGDQVYKIVDFGIANLREATDETRLTGADQFIGTIAVRLARTAGGRHDRSAIRRLQSRRRRLRDADRTGAVRWARCDRDRDGAPVVPRAAPEPVPPAAAGVGGPGRRARAGEAPRGPVAEHGGLRRGDRGGRRAADGRH